MSNQADQLNELRAALDNLSVQIAQIQRRLIALEQGSSSAEPPLIPRPTSRVEASNRNSQQLESRVGLTIVNRIGAITLAIGIAFFFKYAVDSKWIGASGRVFLGVVTGLLLIGVADWLRKRDQRVFSQGVCGCGLAILYISLYASFAYYQILPQAVAFVAMAGACAIAVILSFRYNHPAIAALGLVGGFLTPPLLENGRDHPWLLFPYLLILDICSLAIAMRRRWAVLYVLAFAGTAILFTAWASAAGAANIGVGLLFLCIFFVLFFAASIRWSRGTKQTMPLVLLILNAFWVLLSASTLSQLHDSTWMPLFALALAIVYVVGGAYSTRADPRLSITLYAIGHACLLYAVIRELNTWAMHNLEPLAGGNFISESVSVFLALYAVAMITSGVIRKLPADRVIGLVLIGIVVIKLYLYDVWLLTRFYRVSAFVALGILLLVASYVYSRFKEKLDLLLK
ncbi:MAG: DUF2339 domain-containing protein [Bryobacteraceae bacterium]